MCLRTQKRVDSEIAPRNHSGVVHRPSASKAKEMPGDPNRCREHARRCAEIARHTPSPEVRDHFTSLEQSWLRLAVEINPVSGFSISSVRFLATSFLRPKLPSRSKLLCLRRASASVGALSLVKLPVGYSAAQRPRRVLFERSVRAAFCLMIRARGGEAPDGGTARGFSGSFGGNQ